MNLVLQRIAQRKLFVILFSVLFVIRLTDLAQSYQLSHALSALGFLGAAIHSYLEPKPPGAAEPRQDPAVYAGIGPSGLRRALIISSLICIGTAFYLRWWP
ncbi:MAG TPA: hypothetical protein VIT92_13510 [Burkholderiaceae bacterium]